MIEEFERHLRGTNLSENTISSYLFALRQYSSQYDGITKKNLRAYKVWLIENYKPKTVNLRLRAMQKRGLPLDFPTMQANIMDVAGVRVICSFEEDVFFLAKCLKGQSDIEIITEKDYISHPKPNGYRSLHLTIRLPVFFAEKEVHVPVEIQLRTIAMDFWASLEHTIRYKKNLPINTEIETELKECADSSREWDIKMERLLHPFYYINYTLTTMGAMEFKKKYAEDKAAAWQDYLKLCKTGGSRSYLETLRYANLANPFEAGSVERACGYAEEILLKQIAEQEQKA